jgi:hypothetical protein
MRSPTIPSTLRICSTCCDNLAAEGKLECVHCDASRRFRNALGERLYAIGGFMSPRITEVPQPRESDLWERQPRVEVPLDYKPAGAIDVAVRRVIAWFGLLVLLAFSFGWVFGSFHK